MTKILHVITRLDMGGSAQNTLKTCMGLSSTRYHIILISGLSHESRMTDSERLVVDENVKIARQKGVSVLSLPALIRRIDPVQDTIALLLLMRLIYREKPKIVHTHSSKAGILGRLAAWLLRVPVIVHTPHGHVFHGHFSHLLSKAFLVLERIFDKITARTIALTDGERDDYIEKFVSRPDKLITIHSGVDVKKFMSAIVDTSVKKESFAIAPDDRVVGTVGWLLPIKGPVYLLKAMHQVWQNHPDVKLMLVGKGELEPQLRAMADDFGVRDRVLFPGWCEDIHEIMPIFDIFVLPSLNEGMGRVIVEAMAAGKPVVASNTGGIPDMVIDGKTGFLAAPRDSDGLAEAINHLLEDSKLRQSMGQAGRERCHLYSEELMIEKIDQLYRALLGENCRQSVIR